MRELSHQPHKEVGPIENEFEYEIQLPDRIEPYSIRTDDINKADIAVQDYCEKVGYTTGTIYLVGIHP